ncbi:hypothetical protein L198_05801 [Cryptococcus wingfieldii CBS 7118]|uniref:BTB domain-containing protein n=1 Tax=Cryptococcus wingfieldii CBS 7118 TaxID=1295528 RepID=A0A1E3IU55_9TREE|nr:hypothetical protein L198_05801 [Cryptococcus wingfieldii CBS 7118]ODN92129.1 hypothetical protein L198_05801 [Cryptococcus wingfieldii CBS 7118]
MSGDIAAARPPSEPHPNSAPSSSPKASQAAPPVLQPPQDPLPPSYHIGSPTGSMSMSQRRGARPAFLSPTRGVRGASQSAGVSSTRGLPTPTHSAGLRSEPYPSPIPLLTAPITPAAQQQHPLHQSAPVQSSGHSHAGPSHTPKHANPNPYQLSLDEIPKRFVLKKLVELAPKYWYSPDTADCHIVVPLRRPHRPNRNDDQGPRTAVPHDGRGNMQLDGMRTAVPSGSFAEQQSRPRMPGPGVGGSGAHGAGGTMPDVVSSSQQLASKDLSMRRGSLPETQNPLDNSLVFPLHRDYITTQSSLFHTLLRQSSAQATTPTQRDANGRLVWQAPVYKGARVLPTRAGSPKAIQVPLPDPSSFGVILHYLYWHDAEHFNYCLTKGIVTWQGVIRNIEYLGLDPEIKHLAGKWWKRWVKPVENGDRSLAAPSMRAASQGKARGGGMAVDDDDDEEDRDNSSGIDADDEDYEQADAEEDGFADHVSSRLSLLGAS